LEPRGLVRRRSRGPCGSQRLKKCREIRYVTFADLTKLAVSEDNFSFLSLFPLSLGALKIPEHVEFWASLYWAFLGFGGL